MPGRERYHQGWEVDDVKAPPSKPWTGNSSRLEHRRRLWDGVTIASCLIGLAALGGLPWLIWSTQLSTWHVKEEAFTTLLQVVPATIVAVFVFAVGAIFIIVQIIGPALGSRAIEALLLRRRARACVIVGIILLLACMALTALALIMQEGAPEPWEALVGSVLAVASFFYVPLSIWCISTVFHDFVSPGAYSRLLSRWGVLRRGSVAADWAFHQVRALRQWLRTACGTGESRDIVFALESFQNLLDRYCDEARPGKNKPLNEELREKILPSEYSRADEIVNSRWRQLLDPNSVPPYKISQKGWFGDELGRALARSAEVGIQSETLLRRDLDRLLVALGRATLQLADVERRPEKTRRPLGEEAGFLLDRIAEIGMYSFPSQDNMYSDWFVRPALILASLERKLENIDAQVTGPAGQKHSLAGRSLAAWCLVNYTLQQSKGDTNPMSEISAHGIDRLGNQARIRLRLWDEAWALATGPAMCPSWMPPVDDDPGSQRCLTTFIADLQVLVAAQSGRRT